MTEHCAWKSCPRFRYIDYLSGGSDRVKGQTLYSFGHCVTWNKILNMMFSLCMNSSRTAIFQKVSEHRWVPFYDNSFLLNQLVIPVICCAFIYFFALGLELRLEHFVAWVCYTCIDYIYVLWDIIMLGLENSSLQRAYFLTTSLFFMSSTAFLKSSMQFAGFG